ncbi:MAG: hypothetical protein WA862_11005 [Solirubrobacterales bacterium]
MQEPISPYEAERLQRAVLALAFDLHPAHLSRRQIKEDIGEGKEVFAAVSVLVRSRLVRWDDESLALTGQALLFDRLAL